VTLVDVAAGGQHTCALLSDRSVRCWGDNTWQQLGSTTVMRSTVPLLVDGAAEPMTYATQICSGARHSCVMMTDGSVRCWGAGGALGNGSATASATPVKVAGLTEGSQSVTRIACGGTTSCALMSDGSARCWSAVVGRSLSF
jgi:alpha-tubulin suppressor-like RCC1 family protein